MKENKGFILPFLLIILGALVIIGISLGIYKFRCEPKSQASTPVQNTPALTPTTPPDETANWKTYSNKQLKFIVMYPQDWKVGESTGSISPGYYPDIQNNDIKNINLLKQEIGNCLIIVFPNPKNITLKQWIDEGFEKMDPNSIEPAKKPLLGGSPENTTLGGEEAQKLSIFEYDHTGIIVAAVKNSMIYNFVYDLTEGNQNYTLEEQKSQGICIKILSTFKFLD